MRFGLSTDFRARCALAAVLSLALLAAPAPSAAEGFIDLAFGAAFTDDERIDIRNCRAPDCTVERFSFDGDFQDSFAFSLRGGGWFNSSAPWFGIGGGVSVFEADLEGVLPNFVRVRDADLLLLPITVQLLFRIPIMPDERIPGGRIQPYVAVGPAFTLSVLQFNRLSDNDDTDLAFDVGADVRGGVTVMLERWVGVFAEYRYTYTPVDFEGFLFDPKFEADLDTHHVNGGISFRF